MLAVQRICWNLAEFACSPTRRSIRLCRDYFTGLVSPQNLNGPKIQADAIAPVN
jgi:hypothetical protein